ncbi:MAG TPA: heavy metal translocating P-type ATPase metal-binding domain-containing protein, partial [Acetobacteraceae bacterium]|nr:heavy metal translocating P-type ATPase metal-binding domain-containing protein [Acetobacteraceae bacterium]
MSDVALAPLSRATAHKVCAHCGEDLRGLAADAEFCCTGCASAHAIIGAAGLGAFYRRLEEAHAHKPIPLDTDFAPYARAVGPADCELDLLV